MSLNCFAGEKLLADPSLRFASFRMTIGTPTTQRIGGIERELSKASLSGDSLGGFPQTPRFPTWQLKYRRTLAEQRQVRSCTFQW